MARTRIQMLLLVVALTAAISGASASSIPEELPHNPLEHDPLHPRHFDGGEHNAQFDHEAFLGPDESKKFDSLTPEESRRRLGVIVDRIDENKDGSVTLAELKNWIAYTQRRYIEEDVGRVWKQHNPDNNETISWDSYMQTVYGFMDDLSPDEKEQEENGVSYKSLLKRDRYRWSVADQDLDDNLTKDEFTAFLHPEDHPSMKGVVLRETITDLDKDHDGKISVDEYIGDMYRSTGAEDEEPEWVANEREAFSTHRDLDKDGYLNEEEVKQWIAPHDFDHSEAEAKHLLFEADADHDDKLTKEEILDKYDVFVGSQATDFGEALARHDEF
uniref:Reticulocalbin-3 n=2 Tax=Drosophila melanogaster TaxID=7227 RepID=I1V500_DROME|nr:supercoiling factor variant A [Drosophila melanogaster]AFI26261.1 supercoiling factor variant C [Drosophila melanogaster]